MATRGVFRAAGRLLPRSLVDAEDIAVWVFEPGGFDPVGLEHPVHGLETREVVLLERDALPRRSRMAPSRFGTEKAARVCSVAVSPRS